MTDDTAPPDPDQADYDQLVGTVGQSLPLQSALQVTNIANQLRQVARRLDEVALRGHDTSRRQRLIEAAQDLEAHVERLNELAPGDEKMAHFLATMDESPLGTPLAKAQETLGRTLRNYGVAVRRVEELTGNPMGAELRDMQIRVGVALAADACVCSLNEHLDQLDSIFGELTAAVEANNLDDIPTLRRRARLAMDELHHELAVTGAGDDNAAAGMAFAASELRHLARRLEHGVATDKDRVRRLDLLCTVEDLGPIRERLAALAPDDPDVQNALAGSSSDTDEESDTEANPGTIRVEPGTLVSGQWRLGALAADIPISCALCASMDWLDRIYHQMTEAVDAGNLAALPELTREARQTMADLHRQLDLIEPNGQHTHADPTSEGPRAVAVTDDGPPASEPQA